MTEEHPLSPREAARFFDRSVEWLRSLETRELLIKDDGSSIIIPRVNEGRGPEYGPGASSRVYPLDTVQEIADNLLRLRKMPAKHHKKVTERVKAFRPVQKNEPKSD